MQATLMQEPGQTVLSSLRQRITRSIQKGRGMLEAAIFMVVALVSTVALWRFITPTLADRQAQQPVRIEDDDELRRRK